MRGCGSVAARGHATSQPQKVVQTSLQEIEDTVAAAEPSCSHLTNLQTTKRFYFIVRLQYVAHMGERPNLSFGPNWGSQVGVNQGTINNEFHVPGKLPVLMHPRNSTAAVSVDPLVPASFQYYANFSTRPFSRRMSARSLSDRSLREQERTEAQKGHSRRRHMPLGPTDRGAHRLAGRRVLRT